MTSTAAPGQTQDLFPRVSARARSTTGTTSVRRPGTQAVKRRDTRISAWLAQVERRTWLGMGGAGAVLGCAGLFLVVDAAIGPRVTAAAATTGGANILAQSDRPMTAPAMAGAVSMAIGANENLQGALERAKVAPSDVTALVQGLSGIVDASRLGGGTPFNITFGSAVQGGNTVSAMTMRVSLDMAVTITRDRDRFIAKPVAIAVDHTPLRFSGDIGSRGVTAALTRAGLSDKIATTYLNILSRHVEMKTITAADRFDVIVERDVAATGEGRIGKVIYAGLYQANGLDTELSQWTMNGRLDWYDASEVTTSTGGVQRPVPGVVSSNYGARFHPILGYTRMHKGMDFKAGYGTPILAVQTGYVSYAGWMRGYGEHVELTHGGGLSTSYSHMSSMIVGSGQLVRQGQVIGYVGATGLATGPHLHFELHRGGMAINPATVAFSVGPRMSGSDLAGYENRLNALLRVPITNPRAMAATTGNTRGA